MCCQFLGIKDRQKENASVYVKMCRAQRGGKFFGCGYVFFNTKGMQIIQCQAWIRTKFPDFP